MQVGEGKVTRKSDKITPTPSRGHLAEVTPRPTVTKGHRQRQKRRKVWKVTLAQVHACHLQTGRGPQLTRLEKEGGKRTSRTFVQGGRAGARSNSRRMGTETNRTQEGRVTRGGTARSSQRNQKSHPAKIRTTNSLDEARRLDCMMMLHPWWMRQATVKLLIWR